MQKSPTLDLSWCWLDSLVQPTYFLVPRQPQFPPRTNGPPFKNVSIPLREELDEISCRDPVFFVEDGSLVAERKKATELEPWEGQTRLVSPATWTQGMFVREMQVAPAADPI
jgi:hypothetical protein